MSNNQMIGVPRELVEFAVGFKRNGHKNLTDQRSDQDNAQDKLSVLLSQPAEQHQGELVGEVVAFGEGLHEIAWSAGRMPKLGAKLYTHADPAEVERLREENRRLHEAREFLDGVNQGIEDKLRAQLFERDALLKRQPSFIRALEQFEADDGTFVRLADVLDALSASAERSATVELKAPELTEDLREILGRPNFTCHFIAKALRVMGHSIAHKSEDEQAVVIHWLLGIYLKHGPDWRQRAAAELEEASRSLST